MQPFVGRELFAAGFVSCWSQLKDASQRQLVRSLEMAFSSPNIPPDILATLLNLVSLYIIYLGAKNILVYNGTVIMGMMEAYCNVTLSYGSNCLNLLKK